jgi:DNA (cytosine-5)-methyltransferase 1
VRLLDLFCGAGGCSVGYDRAGFDVTGVDIEPHPDYPFNFRLGDALEVLDDLEFLAGFDAVHASPPCQAYTPLGAKDGRHKELIGPVRDKLVRWGGAYVIENVEAARHAMLEPLTLCGSTFSLGVRRHRLFETNWFAWAAGVCSHKAQGEIRAYYGKKGWAAWTPGGAQVQSKDRKPLLRGTVEQAADDMGIDWMGWDDLREAVPPAYTEFLGEQLATHLSGVAA